MTDIVERLRALAREYWQHRPHYEEAADEIERLRGELHSVHAHLAHMREETARLRAEIKRESAA